MSLITVDRACEVAENRLRHYCRTLKLSKFLCLDIYILSTSHISQYCVKVSAFGQDTQVCEQKAIVEADFIASKQASQWEDAKSC